MGAELFLVPPEAGAAPKDRTRRSIPRWIAIAAALAGGVLLDEWVATYLPDLPARVGLLFGLTYAALRPWQPKPADPARRAEDHMLAEVGTALEHLRSMQLLLEISESHGQPVPRAVPVNLRLAVKHLEGARERLAG